MFGVEWADLTHAAAFLAGTIVGVVLTIRLTKVLAEERRRRNHDG